MDLSSILPLLMGGGLKGGQNQNTMSAILNAMNNKNQTASAQKSANQGGLDPSLIMSLMNKNNNGNSGANQTLDLVNLMSAMTQKNNRPTPKGLSPIRTIIPNEFLGQMLKLLDNP